MIFIVSRSMFYGDPTCSFVWPLTSLRFPMKNKEKKKILSIRIFKIAQILMKTKKIGSTLNEENGSETFRENNLSRTLTRLDSASRNVYIYIYGFMSLFISILVRTFSAALSNFKFLVIEIPNKYCISCYFAFPTSC